MNSYYGTLWAASLYADGWSNVSALDNTKGHYLHTNASAVNPSYSSYRCFAFPVRKPSSRGWTVKLPWAKISAADKPWSSKR